MLLDRAAALAAKITSFQALKADATEAEAYANRAKQIRTVAGRLDKSAQGWRRLSQAGVKPDRILTTAGVLATKATDLREKLVEDRTVLQDPPFDLKYDFSDRLAKVSELADAAISASVRKRSISVSSIVAPAAAMRMRRKRRRQFWSCPNCFGRLSSAVPAASRLLCSNNACANKNVPSTAVSSPGARATCFWKTPSVGWS